MRFRPVPAALVLIFAISALAQVSGDAVTAAAAAPGSNNSPAAQPSSVNVAAAAAAAAVPAAATAPAADSSVSKEDAISSDDKAPTFLGKLLQELERDDGAPKQPSQQADGQPAASGNAATAAPEAVVGGLMSLPGSYDDPNSYVYKRINTPTKPSARESQGSAADPENKDRHMSHLGPSEGRNKPEGPSRGADNEVPRAKGGATGSDSSSKAELKWLGGSRPVTSTGRLSSDGTVRSKRVYSVTEYRDTVPKTPSSYSYSQPYQRGSMQPGSKAYYQPYQTTNQQPKQYQQYTSGQYAPQQGAYGSKSPYSYASPRLPLPRSQQDYAGGAPYTGGGAYRTHGYAAPMPNPGAPRRSRYTPYTPESAWDTYQDAPGSYGQQVDYGYGVGYDDSLYGTGYDEPLTGDASYQQPSYSPYNNEQFSSGTDSYGSSRYDSGYGSAEYGDGSSMYDSLGGVDDLDSYDFESFYSVQERNYRDSEGYDRWGFDEQGYNKDGLSRREIISLLRMVLRAEDDSSSRGGRGYEGAEAEVYGHKVQKGKAQAMHYLKSYLESFSNVRPRTTATSGTRAATKSAPGQMGLGLRPQQPAATMRAAPGSDSRPRREGPQGELMRSRPREEEGRQGPQRSSRPRDPWDPKDRE